MYSYQRSLSHSISLLFIPLFALLNFMRFHLLIARFIYWIACILFRKFLSIPTSRSFLYIFLFWFQSFIFALGSLIYLEVKGHHDNYNSYKGKYLIESGLQIQRFNPYWSWWSMAMCRQTRCWRMSQEFYIRIGRQ